VKKKILIVEDNKDSLEILGLLVETFQEASPNPRTSSPCFVRSRHCSNLTETMAQQIFYLLVTLSIVATLWSF
jgi:hypothetical protein